MLTLLLMYFVAALASSAIFIVAGRRSRQTKDRGAAQSHNGLPNDPLWAENEIDVSDSSPHADAGGALRLALNRVAPVMIRQSVQAEIAAPLGLWVRMRGGTLTELLEELLTTAIHSAPTSRMLLVAATRGDSVCISVMDDMPGADATIRRASVRGLMARVATRGGVLDIDVKPLEGTTMTLRLAAARDDQNGLQRPEALPYAPSITTGSAFSQ